MLKRLNKYHPKINIVVGLLSRSPKKLKNENNCHLLTTQQCNCHAPHHKIVTNRIKTEKPPSKTRMQIN